MPIVCRGQQAAASISSEPPRILIVDDQLVVRGAVRSALERLDKPMLIIEAADGEEALSIMRHAKVDVIFCDVYLPGISGAEALAHAYGQKSQRPFMVLMSTMQPEALRTLGHKVGVYEIILKPFRPTDVVNAMKAYERLKQVTRILLVDDSATARKLMTRLLSYSHFHIDLTEAGSGADAIALAREQVFDVIICDFNMPDLDGAETVTALNQLNPAAQFVIVSTEQKAPIVQSAQFAGAFAFLKKPFGASDIDALLHNAFALRRPGLAKATHAVFSKAAARG